MSDRNVGRPRRVKLAASVTAAMSLVAGVLLFAEHDAGARALPRPRPTTASILANLPTAPSMPVIPSFPTALPAISQLPQGLPVAQGANNTQVLRAAQAAADQGVSTARGVVAQQSFTSAIPQQTFPAFLTSLVCPVLLQTRAQVSSTIGALINAFPFLSPQLTAIRSAALAQIDAQLAQFGCPVPSGV